MVGERDEPADERCEEPAQDFVPGRSGRIQRHASPPCLPGDFVDRRPLSRYRSSDPEPARAKDRREPDPE
jgi:hypothetical protein